MTAGPRFTNGNMIGGKDLIRQMMDEGRTFDEMVDATGFSESTVENYQYAMRRPGETIRPNGRPKQARRAYVKMVMRCQFTLEQSDRLIAAATRYGYRRPALLIEQLVAAIVRDDLIHAVLDPDEVPHGDS
jgi:predicted alpha/beta-hydrolase family hydrolase